MFWMHYCIVNPNCYVLRTVAVTIVGDPIFRIFTVLTSCFYYGKVREKQDYLELPKMLRFVFLTHCILVDSSTAFCWMSLFIILGVSGLFCHFIPFLMENSVSKQCRP